MKDTTLSSDALFKLVKSKFDRIQDHRHNPGISLSDSLMSGLMLFSLKDKSLLAFDEQRNNKILKKIYNLKDIPSDTNLRKTLDEIDPISLRRVFTAVFSTLQRGKGLEDMVFHDDHYLIAIDGSHYFSSEKVHCDNCIVKNHRGGNKTYSHSLLAAVMVHPYQSVVIPLCPEAIKKQDGSTKNDCEQSAVKRLLSNFRREHSKLKAIMVEDALFANAPHIKELKKHNLRYIINIKPGSHKYLFRKLEETIEYTKKTDKDGTINTYRYQNDVSLNESQLDTKVNVLEYWEEKPNGQNDRHFSWITDLELNQDNVHKIMRGGRARWHIENETFNTLKNQGYNFDHNFGHGHNNLSTVFGYLMMLAFLIDQIQQKMLSSLSNRLTMF